MPNELPDPHIVMRAIELYLAGAYTAGEPPPSVKAVVEALRSCPTDFYAAKPFARAGDPSQPKLSLRLGNRFYPHMKLVIEPAPTGASYLFRADTHDRHICPPPEHPEYAAFMELRGKNQQISEAVEGAWDAAGIPTFKTYLQQDLARRQTELRNQGTPT